MSRRGWALFALMGVLWGVPYLMIKVVVTEVPPPVLVFARAAIGALCLLPLALRGGHLATLARRWRPLAAFAVLEMVVATRTATTRRRGASAAPALSTVAGPA
jgi:drug/metabolite transporter (DMT)-like permease